MKSILALAAAAIALAAPAHAFPQWIQVAGDTAIFSGVFANYNSVRGTGSIRSVDTSTWHKHQGHLSITFHVNCKAWQYSATTGDTTSQWSPIGMGTVIESTAYLICPGAKPSPEPPLFDRTL